MSAPPDRHGRDARRRGRDVAATEHLLRELAPQVLGAVVRRYRDFAACRGRGAGGADRGRDAVAARGHARQSARLADPGRVAAHDRSRARASRAPPPRATRRQPDAAGGADRAAADTDGATERDDTLVLLFMCCHPALTPAVRDRAHAARGRRPDDRRDRERVPRARGDDGAADQPREAEHQDARASRSRCRAGERTRGAARRRAARALSDLQRGLHGEHRDRARSAPICRARRSA